MTRQRALFWLEKVLLIPNLLLGIPLAADLVEFAFGDRRRYPTGCESHGWACAGDLRYMATGAVASAVLLGVCALPFCSGRRDINAAVLLLTPPLAARLMLAFSGL